MKYVYTTHIFKNMNIELDIFCVELCHISRHSLCAADRIDAFVYLEILISSIKFMYKPSFREIQEKSICVCERKVPGKYE
jgi:hypothetical protein